MAKSIAPMSLKNFSEDQKGYQYIRVINRDEVERISQEPNLLQKAHSPIEPKPI